MKKPIEFKKLMEQVYNHPDYVAGMAYSIDDIIDRAQERNDFTQNDYDIRKSLVIKHKERINKNVSEYMTKAYNTGDMFRELDTPPVNVNDLW